MNTAAILETLTTSLKPQTGIQALFLSGSHANGMADALSDLDFVLIAEEGATDTVAAQWRQALEQVGQIVLWRDRTPVPVLINAITADWTRYDVIMLRADQMGHHTRAALKPVFDPDDLWSALRATAADKGPDPRREIYQIEEFLRVLGLLHVAIGRADPINGVTGLTHLRTLLIDLMIAETAAPHRGGALHLNRLLSARQQEVLTALPPLQPDTEAVIAAHLAYAAAYLPLARARAAALGLEWPDAFEAATWRKLKDTLGIKPPVNI